MHVSPSSASKLLAPLLLILLSQTGCRLSKNFHEVDPGNYYRSAQLTGEEFEQAIDEQGIRTIVNLRGAHLDEGWYQDEVAVAEEHGVALVDIRMSADHLPHREALIELLDVLRDGERPLLVHCRAGADRTGEATAIYALEYMGQTREQALEMVTWEYWHVELFKPAKRYFIREVYQDEAWAREVYDPCAPDQVYEYYDQEDYCPRAARRSDRAPDGTQAGAD